MAIPLHVTVPGSVPAANAVVGTGVAKEVSAASAPMPPQTAGTTSRGETFNPKTPSVPDVTSNNVIGQTYGKGPVPLVAINAGLANPRSVVVKDVVIR